MLRYFCVICPLSRLRRFDFGACATVCHFLPSPSSAMAPRAMKKEAEIPKTVKNDKSGVLKKPAAKKAAVKNTLVESVQQWKDTPVNDENQDQGDIRDKGKGEKYKKMMTAGSLPPHVIDLIENQARKSVSPRCAKTSAINQLFKRLPNGTYELQLSKPLFAEAKTMYEEKFGKDSHKAMPQRIFKSLYFHGNQAALDEAIEAGEVKETKDDEDNKYYCFRCLEVGTLKGKKETQTITRTRAVNNDQANALAVSMASLGFSFIFETPKILVNDDGSLTKAMVTVMQQAKQAEIKLGAELTKLLCKFDKDSTHYKNLKNGHIACTKCVTDIDYVLSFEEFQMNQPVTGQRHKDFMHELATVTEKTNEDRELARGFLKSKGIKA